MTMPFYIEEKLQEEIDRRIKEYENTAEECFQETADQEMGNQYLSKSHELKDLWKWMEANL